MIKKPKDLLAWIAILILGVILGLQIKVASAATNNSNILYTKNNCPHCDVAKSKLHYYCVSFRAINIDRNNPYGISAVPVLRTAENNTLVGDDAIVQYAQKNKKCH